MNTLEFWEITPFEFMLKADAYSKKTKEDQEERLILTWLGAAWQRSKTMPDIKKLIGNGKEQKKQRPEMTDEEMFNAMKKMCNL
jgi:hypothetical protein